MAILHDFYCSLCDAEAYDRWTDDVPECCGHPMKVLLHRINSNEWGGPRTYIHLRDEPFSSRSELNRYAREKGLSLYESSEKCGGARNDMYDGVGKIFSGPGFSKKPNKLHSESPRRN